MVFYDDINEINRGTIFRNYTGKALISGDLRVQYANIKPLLLWLRGTDKI